MSNNKLPPRECPICGKTFIPKASHRMFCYPEWGEVDCSTIAASRRRRKSRGRSTGTEKYDNLLSKLRYMSEKHIEVKKECIFCNQTFSDTDDSKRKVCEQCIAKRVQQLKRRSTKLVQII